MILNVEFKPFKEISISIRHMKFPKPPIIFPLRVLKLKLIRITIPVQNKIAPLYCVLHWKIAVMDMLVSGRKQELAFMGHEVSSGSSSGARPKYIREWANLVLSQDDLSEFGKQWGEPGWGELGLGHWTRLLGLHLVTYDSEVQSERQRARGWAETASVSEESSEFKIQEGEVFWREI